MNVNLKRSTYLQGQVVSKDFIDVQPFKNITFKRTYEVAKMGLEGLLDSLNLFYLYQWFGMTFTVRQGEPDLGIS